MHHYDIIIIGAGAAGMLCAHFAGANGKRIALLEHNKQVGRKILISGGGRCNFTNLNVAADDYYSQNPHFVKSALSRFSSWDFISMVMEDEIPYVEKSHGELFCKNSAKDINALLLKRIHKANINLILNAKDLKVEKKDSFIISNDQLKLTADNLVIATGGLSIPPIGATGFGYEVAKSFGHKIFPATPALVGFKVEGTSELSGISLIGRITTKSGYQIEQDILLTHKGLSGPACLKASLFWNSGESLEINWSPRLDFFKLLEKESGATKVEKLLKKHFPNKFADWLLELSQIEGNKTLGDLNKKEKILLADNIHKMEITPQGTEGFRKAEVTRGGVDTSKVSSKTMESQLCPGLYFIGEVLDITGNLGGYNFQWAWASAHAAGKALA